MENIFQKLSYNECAIILSLMSMNIIIDIFIKKNKNCAKINYNMGNSIYTN